MTPPEWKEAHPGNYTKGRVRPIDRVVIHVADGTLAGTAAWFADARADVSAHYTVGMDGRVIQSVSEANTAWHAGDLAMNQRSVGIEHEGQPSKGPWTPSEAQLLASAALVGAICIRHNIPVDRQHIIGHFEVNPGRAARRNCPGPTWPWDRYIKLVQASARPPGHVRDGQEQQRIRLFDPATNKQVGWATLITGSDKCYVLPETLADLRSR